MRRAALRRWVKRAVWIALAAAIAVAIALGLRSPPVPVDVAVARRAPMEVTVDEDGRTRVRERYVVTAPLTGHVRRHVHHAGDEVRAGEVVAQMTPVAAPLLDARTRAQAEAAVQAARAAVARAQASAQAVAAAAEQAARDVQRAERLFAAQAVPRVDLERAQLEQRSRAAELRAARDAVRASQAERTYAEAVLRSPDAPPGEVELRATADGRVLQVFQDSEQVVQAGTPLLEIGDVTHLEVVIDLLTADAVRVKAGDTVKISRWGGAEALNGRVRLVESRGVTRVSALGIEEQRVDVLVDLVDPPESRAGLGDGFEVEAHVRVWSAPDVLQVPASATFRHGNGWAVFRVGADGKVERVVVDVGQRSAETVEVLRGLEAGDTVVDYPGQRLEDGVRVQVRGS